MCTLCALGPPNSTGVATAEGLQGSCCSTREGALEQPLPTHLNMAQLWRLVPCVHAHCPHSQGVTYAWLAHLIRRKALKMPSTAEQTRSLHTGSTWPHSHTQCKLQDIMMLA